MENRSESDKKIMQFIAYPDINIKLSSFEKLILDAIHKLGQASVNDILTEVKPDWNKYKDISKDVPFKGRLIAVKHLWSVTMVCSKIISASRRLKQLECIRINERGYE
jgi:hypothetical protein